MLRINSFQLHVCMCLNIMQIYCTADADLEVCDDLHWRRRKIPDQCDTAVSRMNNTKILGSGEP